MKPETMIGVLVTFSLLWFIVGGGLVMEGLSQLNWREVGMGVAAGWLGTLTLCMAGIWQTLERIAKK